MTQVALLGGSFDPPHLGHQMMCLWALSAACCDEVWLIPCYQHAFNKRLTPFPHRMEMCQRTVGLFAEGTARVSSIEQQIGGESRTLATLQRLRAKHPGHRFRLLIGADILPETRSWYRFEEIQEIAPPLVVGRAGFAGGETHFDLPPISSTEIRKALAQEKPVSDQLPASVMAYITDNGLYGG